MQKHLLTLLIYLVLYSTLRGQDFAPNEILIKFENLELYSISASSVGCYYMESIEGIQTEVWCVPDTLIFGENTITGVENIADYFSSLEGVVAYAEPNYIIEPSWEPNDLLYDSLWAMPQIEAPLAWDLQQGDGQDIVAVLDSGIDWTHPDLRDNIWQNLGEDTDGDGVLMWTGTQWIFDPDDENGIDDDGNGYVDDLIGWDFYNNDNTPEDICGHGTHVSGTIGAVGNNDMGVIGVNPNVRLMALKILDYNPINSKCVGNMSQILKAIEYAVNMGATTSNNSWGGYEYSEALYNAIALAGLNSHLFVAAAGNDDLNTDQTPVYPAGFDLPNIISVAATDQADLLSTFSNGSSNYGANSVDLAAPGSYIYSTMPYNQYDYKQGTSMATPHVSGAVSLIAAQCEDYDYQVIKDILIASVDPITALDGKCVSAGRLNIGTALSMIESSCEYNCLESDSLALLALYNATDGPNWTNTWDLNQPVNTWFGVSLSEDGCSVDSLDLSNTASLPYGNNLNGILPVELGNLSNLRYLRLSYNDLMEEIPSELGNLTNLTYLNLSANDLSGTIPLELGNLTSLEDLILTNNSLSGDIPSELGNLTNLVRLYLNFNDLSGEIPLTLANLSNLAYLHLEYNDLSGTIPPVLSNLTNLEHLVLTHNSLSGEIPSELGNLANLVRLYLNFNDLIGEIPLTLGNLSNLEGLHLNYNFLSGEIPSVLGSLPNLEHLILSANYYITGEIPIEIGNLSNLLLLHLNDNALSGTIPEALGNLTNLTELHLNDNSLSGSIPESLSNLTNLTELYLNDNSLSGCYPALLCNQNSIFFDFDDNDELQDGGYYQGFLDFCDGITSCDGFCENLGFIGEACNDSDSNTIYDTIQEDCSCIGEPATICLESALLALIALYDATNGDNWTNSWDLAEPVSTWYGVSLTEDGCSVDSLDLSSNNLIGEIPAQLGHLMDLEFLQLSGNLLSGEIPSELGNLSNLLYIDLGSNSLSGEIPSELGDLSNLSLMNFSNNSLGGEIPSELGDLSNLNYIYFFYNFLSGEIPSELGNLSNLLYMGLSNNFLSGEIPSEFGNLSSLSQMSLSNNFLSGEIPSDLGNLSNLWYIDLSNNSLSACYPPSLCNLNLTNPLFDGNTDLPDGGSDQGFIDFCNGDAPCEEDCLLGMIGDSCNDGDANTINDIIQEDCTCIGELDCAPLIVDLGSTQTIGCGEEIILSTNLIDMAYTLWDYEGDIFAVDQESVSINLPGSYTVVVGDICGNTASDQIEITETENCVWPGDINDDYIVNAKDVLQWGLNFGEEGSIRENASFDWIGQFAADWDSAQNDINDKHSDADGNGIISHSDLEAITENYGNIHGEIAEFSISSTDGSIDGETNWEISSISEGELSINMVLEQENVAAHGLTWQVDFGSLEVGAASFVYNSDWFGMEETEVVSYSYFNEVTNRLDIAITHIDGQSIIGGGPIGQLIIVEESVGSWSEEDEELQLVIEDATLMDENGELYSLIDGLDNFSIMSIDLAIDSIKLNPGWNLISLDVSPYDLSVSSVFGNLQDNNLEYVVGYDNGATVYNANGFESLNTLSQLEDGLGYWIKVGEEETLIIEGIPLNTNSSKPLDKGWNLIGFTTDYSYIPEIYFNDLINTDNLINLLGFDSEYLYFAPNDTNNTLVEVKNGSGYWLKADEGTMGGNNDENANRTNVFSFINGSCDLTEGEEVSVQSNGETITTLSVMADGRLMTQAIYGDDLTTDDVIEGLQEGEELQFVANGITANTTINFTADKTITTVDLAFYNTAVNPSSNLRVKAYPNPIRNNELHLELNLSQAAQWTVVDIYDQYGRLVQHFEEYNLSKGHHNLQYDMSSFPQGNYIYQFNTNFGKVVGRLIKIKQ